MILYSYNRRHYPAIENSHWLDTRQFKSDLIELEVYFHDELWLNNRLRATAQFIQDFTEQYRQLLKEII